jgi:hypothetical protein
LRERCEKWNAKKKTKYERKEIKRKDKQKK